MLMTPLQVLVVEDDVDAAESMAALLELEGHATEIAHAGPEALDAARRVKPVGWNELREVLARAEPGQRSA